MLRQEMLCAVPAMEATFTERAKEWLRTESPWWLCSFTFHVILVCSLATVSTQVIQHLEEQEPIIISGGDVPSLVSSISLTPPDTTQIEIPSLPPDPDLANVQPPKIGIDVDVTTSPPPGNGGEGDQLGSGLGRPDGRANGIFAPNTYTPPALGPGPKGSSLVGGNEVRGQGKGNLYKKRLGGSKGEIAIDGRTEVGDRAVVAALNWIMRHQHADGHWSLTNFNRCCRDATCTTLGKTEADAAATALALLPFLAAGHTHQTLGALADGKDAKKMGRNYQRAVNNGLYWLLRNQKPNGDLRAGSTMYAQGLATIALCEVYGMTNDLAVGEAAQRAIGFIQRAQNPKTGGWRYEPGTVDPGDTSVVGWQIMALKSGQMAELQVDPLVLDRAKMFLRTVGSGGTFSYTPGGATSSTMTSVGLLCSQYLGMPRTDPAMTGGTQVLMQSLPGSGPRNVYYVYYATQVMHNLPGPDWDTWNRKMRHDLVDVQETKGCATGSWNPQGDTWGTSGGRLMMTSLAALSLEVYYRYMPLYKLDRY